MEPLTSVLYESKLLYFSKSFEDEVRTFCMNPDGYVSREAYGDVVTVNGHSYSDRNPDTPTSRFGQHQVHRALQVSRSPTACPSPGWRTCSARISSSSGWATCRSASARHRNDWPQHHQADARQVHAGRPLLRAALPAPARHPRHARSHGQAGPWSKPSRHTALRGGGKVLFGAARAELASWKHKVENLYAVGDGAGVTRGLVQASASGVIAARSAMKRL